MVTDEQLCLKLNELEKAVIASKKELKVSNDAGDSESKKEKDSAADAYTIAKQAYANFRTEHSEELARIRQEKKTKRKQKNSTQAKEENSWTCTVCNVTLSLGGGSRGKEQHLGGKCVC
jgi:rubrerythrin